MCCETAPRPPSLSLPGGPPPGPPDVGYADGVAGGCADDRVGSRGGDGSTRLAGCRLRWTGVPASVRDHLRRHGTGRASPGGGLLSPPGMVRGGRRGLLYVARG